MKYFFILLLIICIGNSFNLKAQENPIAKKGILDLRKWDFEKNKQIKLDGEWDFFWKKFILSNDSISKTNDYIKVPSKWNDYIISGKKIGEKGYASYRLKIFFKKTNTHLSLRFKTIFTSYVLYVNGKKISSAGKIATNSENEIPFFFPHIADCQLKDSVWNIVIHVSNFQNGKAGIGNSITLGIEENLRQSRSFTLLVEIFILGALYFMFFYHIGLYFFQKKKEIYLNFSIACLCITTHVLFSGEYLIVRLIPIITWNLVVKIDFLAIILAVVFIIRFLQHLLENIFSCFLFQLIKTLLIILAFIIIIFPSSCLKHFIIPFHFIVVSGGLYIFWKITRIYKQLISRKKIFPFGFAILFAVSINDILYEEEIINTFQMLSYGFFIFIIFQALILSAHYSEANKELEKLSKKLAIANQNLEKKVKNRTEKIEKQKQDLLKQTKAIYKTNEKMKIISKYKDALTGMIVHDLKNPLNALLNISSSPNPKVQLKKAKQQGQLMLNMVLNILDVQKFEETDMKLNIRREHIWDIVREAASQIRFLCLKKNILLKINVPPDTITLCDRSVIIRVLVNLLVNATKYTDIQGEISIYCEEKNDKTILYIEDNGEGIPKDKLHLVFEKYGQVKAKNEGLNRSFGIGLTFCKLVIEAHNEKIRIDSKLGKGTTVSISFKRLYSENNKYKLKEKGNKKQKYVSFDKETVKDIILELKHIEIYQISTIRKILKQIKTEDKAVLAWKENLQEAAESGNEILFQELLK